MHVWLQEAGPSEEDVSSVKSIEQRNWENLQEENAYWQQMLESTYMSRSYQKVRVSAGPVLPHPTLPCPAISSLTFGLLAAYPIWPHIHTATKCHAHAITSSASIKLLDLS